MVEISTISLRQLNRLSQVLHASNEFEGTVEWRRAVLETLLGVLGARSGVFVLTWDDPPVVVVEREEGRHELHDAASQETQEDSRAWAGLLTPNAEGLPAPDFRGMVELAPSGGLPEDRRWEEFLGCIAFRRHEDGATSWLGTFDFDDPPAEVAERTLPLLRILSPAFEAGVEGLRSGDRYDRRLQTVVEAFGEPAILLRRGETEVRANRAMMGLLRHEPEADELRGLFEEFREAGEPRERQLSLGRGVYHVEAEPLGMEGEASGEWVLVRVGSSAPVLPDHETLRERFSLTQRQSEVAILLARGRSDKAIGRELGITWHTARRHVEEALKKLGVSSRAKVMDRLLSRD